MRKEKFEVGAYGTIALTSGIIGILIIPLIASTIAIVFGAIGISRDEKYAKEGLILGIVGWGLMIIVYLAITAGML